jgi:hypothetical protein
MASEGRHWLQILANIAAGDGLETELMMLLRGTTK